MLFIGTITLTGSYDMFGFFLMKAASLAGAQAFPLYLDAALVAAVAILGLIVLSDSIRQWYGYVIQKKPFTTSEVFVTAGGATAGSRHATTCRREEEHGFSLPPGGGCC
jgi:carbon starvation protein